jgi:hypothetical protein
MKPFSQLAAREKDVLAEYMNVYFAYRKKGVPHDKVFVKMFGNKNQGGDGYDVTKYLSDFLSTRDKPVSMDIIRNYATKLRKKGFIVNNEIPIKFLKLIADREDEITFKIEYR